MADRAIVVVISSEFARNIGAWPILAQSGQRAPTGDCIMHCGQIRSPHLPHRRFDGTFGWRRQLLLKVSSVICREKYAKASLILEIAEKGYWSIQFWRVAISRSNTNRVRINLNDICLLSSLSEFDVILLVMVIRTNTNANQTIS